MKILVVGSPHSIFIKNYIKFILNNKNYEIYLGINGDISKGDREIFDKLNVKIINIYEKRGVSKYIPRISNIIALKKALRDITKDGIFDIVHLHYIGNINILKYTYKFFRRATKKLVLTFWGSDILTLEKQDADKIKKLIEVSDCITASTDEMKDRLNLYFPHEMRGKFYKTFFGNELFDLLDKGYDIGDKAYIEDTIDSKKRNIVIGYNASKRQQHIPIIRELLKLDKETREIINLIIPMTYGEEDLSYRKSIEQLLQSSGFKWTILDEYMDFDKTIFLKKNADLFIHGQISDALSSSVLEYLVFETPVLNPVWIPYKEWQEKGIRFEKYSSFDELPNKIKDIIFGEGLNYTNREVILKNFSWSAQKNNWIYIYKDNIVRD